MVPFLRRYLVGILLISGIVISISGFFYMQSRCSGLICAQQMKLSQNTFHPLAAVGSTEAKMGLRSFANWTDHDFAQGASAYVQYIFYEDSLVDGYPEHTVLVRWSFGPLIIHRIEVFATKADAEQFIRDIIQNAMPPNQPMWRLKDIRVG